MYEEMNVAQLRTEARDMFGPGSWIASARREVLVDALRRGEKPDLDETPGLEPDEEKGAELDNVLPAVIAAAIAEYLPEKKSAVDEVKVREMIAEEIAKQRPAKLEIKKPDGEMIVTDRQHELFPVLLQWANLRLNVWLHGPAGSGKTMAARKAAEGLGLQFRHTSLCEQTTKSELAGRLDANSKYQRTGFRECYESGGVFLLDEIDRGRGNTLSWLNAAIENGDCEFPDGPIKRHEDFILIACANTSGTGANRLYNDAKQLGAATLDRFVFIYWGYDEGFERHLAGNDEWVDRVIELRRSADRLGVRHVISPRASIVGARAIANGIKKKHVEEALVFKGLKEETVKKIKAGA